MHADNRIKTLFCETLVSLVTIFALSACGGNGTPAPRPKTLSSIQVSPQGQSLAAGTSSQLSATGTYSDGSTGDVTATVTWGSSDMTLASVNGSGKVSALAVGRPKITATAGSLTSSAQLIVTGSPANNVPRLAFVPNMVDGTLSAYTVNSSTGQLRHNGYQLVGHLPSAAVVERRNKYVYVANSEDNAIAAFAIDQSGGLSPISASPFKDDGNPLALAVDPSGTYLFSANSGSGTVVAYSINSSTGALTPLATSPFSAGAGSSALAIDPSGHFLFVANQAANSISAFTIAVDSGALSPIAGSPFTPGTSPSAVAVDSAGKFLFVANSGSSNVSVFSITVGTGALSEVMGSPFPTGAGMEISGITVTPDGKTVYVSNFGSSSISALSVAGSGALAPVTGSPFPVDSAPRALQVDPSGKFAYALALAACEVEVYSIAADGSLAVANRIRTRQQPAAIAFTAGTTAVTYAPKFAYVPNSGSANVSAFTIDAGTGALTAVVGSPFPVVEQPLSLAVDPSGKFVYVPNFGTPPTGGAGVSAFTIDASTGALTPLVGSPFAVSDLPTFVTVDPSGRFLYVSNLLAGTVSAFTIDATTGALTTVAGSPFPAGGGQRLGFGPGFVAVDPSGRFAYAPSATIWAFTIDATTGALTPVTGSPFNGGTSPTSVAVDPSGRFAYVVDGIGTVSAFAIDATTGALAPESGLPSGVGLVTIDPLGRFAYVPNVQSNQVWAFEIDATSGTLTAAAGSPFMAGSSPQPVAVDLSGRFAYVANGGSNNVSVFTIDTATGALTSAGTAVGTGGVGPGSVATTGTIQ